MTPVATTYRQRFPDMPVQVDERLRVSPHFLGIGKTRKLVDTGDLIAGFYSSGYEINWLVADRSTLQVIARGVIADASPAWGGGQFCIDHIGDEIHIVYTTQIGRAHV